MSLARTCLSLATAAALSFAPAPQAPAADPVKGGDALKLLPADSAIVVVVRMDKLLASDGFKKLRKEVPMIDKEFEAGFKKEFSVEVSNVAQIAVGFAVNGLGPVSVLQLKNPVKMDAIMKTRTAPRFEGDKGRVYEERKVGPYSVHHLQDEFGDSLCLIDDKTLMVGYAGRVSNALQAGDQRGLSERLHAALKVTDATPVVTVAVDVPVTFVGEARTMPIPGIDFEALIDAVSGITVTITETGDNVAVRGVALCKDAKAAQAMKTQGEATRKFMIDAPPEAMIPKEVSELCRKSKIAGNGNLVEATITVKTEDAVAMIKRVIAVEKR
jgi:hypothetical protein